MHAGFLPQSLNDVTLPNAAPTHHHQVGLAADEVAGGQLFQLHPVKCFRIEGPVEALHSFVLGKAGFPDASRHRAFPPCSGLGSQQPVEKAQVREAFFLRPREKFIQCRSLDRNPQRREVTQAAVTQRGRLIRRLRLHGLHRLPWFHPTAPDTQPWAESLMESGAISRSTVPALRSSTLPWPSAAWPGPPEYAPPQTTRTRDSALRAPGHASDLRGDTQSAGLARAPPRPCRYAEFAAIRRRS